MATIIYTAYQTNSFYIIKSTFSTYKLPHVPVIVSVNFCIFNCVENSDKANQTNVRYSVYYTALNYGHQLNPCYQLVWFSTGEHCQICGANYALLHRN